jgi:hypothetical protein
MHCLIKRVKTRFYDMNMNLISFIGTARILPIEIFLLRLQYLNSSALSGNEQGYLSQYSDRLGAGEGVYLSSAVLSNRYHVAFTR